MAIERTREANMVAARNNMKCTGRSVVLALSDSALTTAVIERLERRGWRVYRAASCAEARKMTCRYLPEAVVLPADGPDESGWLTCAKLLRAQPRLRVVLVGEPSADGQRFSHFVGAAALVPPGVGAAELVARVEGAVPVAV
jgi:DNA-binding response OmpR family regulator